MHTFAGISFVPLSMLPSAAGDFDDEVFLTNSAACTGLGNLSMQFSFTCTTQGEVTGSGGSNYFATLTLTANGVTNQVQGYIYLNTLTIAGNAATSQLQAGNTFNTLTIAGISDCDTEGEAYAGLQLTIGGIADCDVANLQDYLISMTLGVNCNFFSPGGVVYYLQKEILWMPGVTLLAGFGRFEEIELDGIANIAVAELYIMEHTLSLDGIADITIAEVHGLGGSITLNGVADFDIASEHGIFDNLLIAGNAIMFVENIYEFVYFLNATCNFTVSLAYIPGASQEPAAQGSFSASCQAIFHRTLTDTLEIVQEIVMKKPTNFLFDTYTVTQEIEVQKVHIETITQTLNLTQDQYASRVIMNTWFANQTINVTKVISRTVTQTYAPTQTVLTNNVISRTVTDTLVYNPTNVQNIPIIGSNSGAPTHQFSYTVPNIHVVLIPRQCRIILAVPSRTIILPCPLFGDSQAPQHEINLKRTMTGDTFTYVKKTKAQKLTYSFDLWSNKYLELRQFYIDFSSEVMTLQNHHAETWLVNILNNPLEFSNDERWMKKGERYSVTLEFEGVKIA